MHCNLIIENLDLEPEINKCLIMAKVENIRIFNNYFLLKLSNKNEWNKLLGEIGSIPNIRFVLTPILEEGFYNGILTESEWKKVNEITQNRVEPQ